MNRSSAILLTAIALAAALTLSQCDSNPTDDDSSTGGGQAGTIAVTVGDANGCVTRRPDYTWTGGNVATLTVTDSAGTTLLYKLASAAGTDAIASPVTQGTPPTGVTVTDSTGDAESKLPKQQWAKVTLERTNGDKGEAWFVPTGGCN